MAICAFLCLPFSVFGVASFPGAEGFGANSTGGRGGDLYFVTNTNNTGTGSLRNGITTATGPRTILFNVSGTIDLLTDLKINKPNLTIAGQTAPGDGITLRRRLVAVENTHDVIVRYIRCRVGDLDPNFEDDSFHVINGTNIMVDHVSASWSVDECLSVTWSTNVSIQWCLISESLKNSQHSKGAHGYGSLLRYGRGGLTFHHNLYTHHDSRNPRPGDNIHLDFVNNVVYDWGNTCGYNAEDTDDNFGGGQFYFTNVLNYVSNYFIAGPATTAHFTQAFDSGVTNSRQCEIYQAGNFIDSNVNGVLDGANTGFGMFGSPYLQRSTPFPAPPVNADSAAVAYQRLLAFVGFSTVRDEVDSRVIGTVRSQTGRLVDAVGPANQPSDYATNTINGTNYVFVRGWPVLNSLVAPPDTDLDGMPNYWELNLGLNPAVTNHNHINADGYTDLEQYLNWLADPHSVGGVNQMTAVNLRTLTGANTNLIFTVVTATNGAIALAGDGITAQFQPTTNFIGLAAFTFTASNIVNQVAFGPVTVAVLVTNMPPVIFAQPAGQTNSAGTTVAFTVGAANAALNYQWRKNNTNVNNGGNVSGATTATLTLTNVAEANAGNYTVVITNFSGSVTSSIATLVVVVPSNTPPTLTAISDYTIIAGATLAFTNSASDADLPPQTLTFSLLNAPAGAALGTNNGVFSWRPLIAQGGSTNPMSVVVLDNGSPSLGATQAFTVFVLPAAQPIAQPLSFVNPQFTLLINGDAGPDYTVQASTNLMDWANLFTTNSPALPLIWSDGSTSNFDQRFYRVLLGP